MRTVVQDLEKWVPCLLQLGQQLPAKPAVLTALCAGVEDGVLTVTDFQKAVKAWPGAHLRVECTLHCTLICPSFMLHAHEAPA